MSFDKPTRKLLANAVAACRDLLAVDIADQLQSAYGLYPDGTQLDVARTEAERRAAQDLRALLAHYESNLPQGKDRPQMAYQRLVREAGFTLLNRLAALRLCEERGLVIECVRQGMESDGFRLYDMLAGGALGNRHQTYRAFLERLFDELARDLGALFDRSNPLSHLFPSEAALSGVLDLLNDPELARRGLWAQDETIGWMYQYYNDPAERKKMREESQAPRNSRELAVRNQFFTPRYVVEFLADNTLGRLWVEMRGGESRLTEACRYLVVSNQSHRDASQLSVNSEQASGGDESAGNAPQRNPNPKSKIANRKSKDPRDLKILDPACGSGHFLLYVFDLLLKIYEEAWGDADLPPFSESGTWLARDYPSLEDLRRAAPELIVRHNLHGVDIDPRAAQIAALALWLRAQRAWQELGVPAGERPQVTRTNVVVAEPMPGDARLLEEFIAGLAEVPFIGQLVRVVFEKMKLAGEAGSLLKVEVDLREALAAAKKQWLTRPEPEQLGLWAAAARPRQEQLRFDLSGISDEQFWLEAEGRALAALSEYARQAENGQGARRRLFAEEAGMGFAFVDLCRKQFDVVLMNPPYGDFSNAIKDYANQHYTIFGNDIYVAFFIRMTKLVLQGGFIGGLTSRTWLQNNSFAELRAKLLKEVSLQLILDLGQGVLDSAMVDTCATVLMNDISQQESIFIRINNEPNKEKLLSELVDLPEHRDIFPVRQTDFLSIMGNPLTYWLPDNIREKFVTNKLLGNIVSIKQGLGTGDDFRFIRAWWEVPSLSLGMSKKWVWLSKGGDYSPWFFSVHLAVDWENDGKAIRNLKDENGGELSRYRGADQYFKEGLTYPLRTIKGFNVRVLPPGCIFTIQGPSIVSDNTDIRLVLAYLNSTLGQLFLESLTSGGAWQVGYIQAVPFFPLNENEENVLKTSVDEILHLLQGIDFQDETSPYFLSIIKPNQTLTEIIKIYRALKSQVYEQVVSYRASIDSVFAKQVNVTTSNLKELFNVAHAGTDSQDEIPNDITDFDFTSKILEQSLGLVFGRWDIRIQHVHDFIYKILSPLNQIPSVPISVLVNHLGLPAQSNQIASEAWLKARPDAITLPEMRARGAEQVVVLEGKEYPATIPDSAYPLPIPWDGILVDDPGLLDGGKSPHPEDLVERARQVLRLLWPENHTAIEAEACEILGVRDLRDYFRKPGGFFADHLKRYSKSRRQAPIYWPLSTASGAYTLWLYYPRLSAETLPTAINRFVDPKIAAVSDYVAALEVRLNQISGRASTELRDELDRQKALLAELRDFRAELLRISALPYQPDLNDGVILNAAPFHRLFRLGKWSKDTESAWKKLQGEEYEWSHIAYILWPERVREVCKTDKSIAIAHGLESVFVEVGGMKKGKARKAAEE